MMIRSMTGYGHAEGKVLGYRILIEVKSVNHRYLEVVVHMPRTWLRLEETLKKKVKNRLSRGRVNVFVTVERDPSASTDVEVDFKLAEDYIRASHMLSDTYGIRPIESVSELLNIPDLFRLGLPTQVDEAFELEMLTCTDLAMDRLTQMRECEGQHLFEDVSKRINKIKQLQSSVQTQYPDLLEHHQNKLKERIVTLLGEHPEAFDEQRFAMEVALIADRTNIDEELTRLNSHIEQFNNILSSEQVVGRKLDFLIQEMNREMNTIGAKSNHHALTNLVVEMKSELEKIREQVQNME